MDIPFLNAGIVKALKTGDKVRVTTLRSLLSDVRYAAIDKYKSEWETKLVASDIDDVIKRQIKKHHESIDMFGKGGRVDLVDKEQAELSILEEFLPPQMSDTELSGLILEALKSGEANFGKLMGMVMAKVAGRADGSRVSQLLKQKLNS